MVSGVRARSSTSSSVVLMSASTCGVNGGMKKKCPGWVSTYWASSSP